MKLIKILFLFSLFSKLLFASSIVGTTKANINVHQGSMNFSIPIVLPKGVNNLSPNLSIKYNSSSNAFGKLGMGLKLSGFSTISVCNEYTKKDIADLSRDYNFCLNGQKLININPSDTYGGNNTEYKTEINNYQKIVSFASENKTKTWKVYTNDGLIYEYGLNQNSIEKDTSDNIVVFRRNKTIDLLGNEINYNYDSSGYIENIIYSNSKIDFIYKNNDVNRFKYYKGTKRVYDKKLEKISIKIENKEINTHLLTYDNKNKNKITKIENCYENECLKPLNITWQEKEDDSIFVESNTTTAKNFGAKTDTYETISGDFTGDGITDIVRYTNNQIYLLEASANNTFMQHLYTSTKNFGTKDNTYETISGDFNADGLTDIVRYTNNQIYTLFSNGNGTFREKLHTTTKNFSTKNSVYYSTSGDYNLDGFTDIIRYTNNQIYTLLSNGDGTFKEVYSTTSKNFGAKNDTYFLASGDYDGNGLLDFIRYTNKDIYILLSKGDGTFTQKNFTTTTDFKAKNDTYYSLSGDFNSDGLTDFIRYTTNKIYILFSKGDATFEEKLFTTSKDFGAKNDTYSLRSGDFNADGLKDIIRYKNKEIYILFSNADGTFEEKSFTTSTDFGKLHDTYQSLSGDFSADGISDFLRYTTNKIYTIQAVAKKELITNISNSVDQDTTITYSDLNDVDIYTSNSDELYPIKDIKGSSKTLVKSIQTINGIKGFNSYSYKYEGLKSHAEYGSLGHKKITRTNDTNADYTTTTYRQDFPFIGTVKEKEKYVNDIKILKEENVYKSSSIESINENIKNIYLDTKNITKYDINGAFLLKVKETQSKPDIYGNITNFKTSTFSTTNETQAFSKEIIKEFKSPSLNNWLVNLVSNIKTIYKKPSGIENIKEEKISYTYDTNGLLLSENILDEDDNKQILKEYKYDSFGNIIKQTLSGTNIEKRFELYTYDTLGKNIIKVVNPIGHIQSNLYDNQDNLKEVISINGLKTTWQYDKLNRKIKEIRADGTSTSWKYSWDNSFSNSQYKISAKTTGAPEVSTFFDTKNRKVRVQRYGFKGDVIFEDTFYDELGRVSKKSTPHYSYEIPNFTHNTYDSLNRLTKLKTKGPNGEDIQKTYSYDKFTSTEKNAKSQNKKTITNPIGQIIKIIEEDNATIEYSYDAIGNLITTKDSKNNTIEIRYDNQGNKTYMNDPDMGEWTYKYNMLGELISQTDAKNQTTTMKYDLLGRLVKRVEKEGESLFAYDVSLNGLGKVSIEQNKDYKKEYFYDELGRVKETKEYINNKSFSTNYVYGEDGKLKTTIHPNGFVLTNEYNEQGYLSAVKSPINDDLDLSYEKLKDSIQENLDKKTEAFNSLIALNTQIEKYRVKALEYYKLAQEYKNIDSTIEEQLLKTSNLLIKTAIELKDEAMAFEKDYKYYERRLNFFLVKLINFNDEQLFKWLMDRFFEKSTTQIDQALAKLEEAKNSLDTIQNQEEFETYKEIVSYYIKETKTIITEAKTNIEIARNYKEKYRKLRDGVDKAYQGMFDNSSFKYYYKILNADEFGRITKSFHGNGLETIKEYNKVNGQLQRLQTGYDGNNDVRDIKYTFDVLNNVTSKNDFKQNITQDYTFDTLNRVTSATTKSDTIDEHTTYTYDSIGNILNKSDLGDYTYKKAHQVKTAGNITYTYDENGNVIKKDELNTSNSTTKTTNITYSSYNKPVKIEDGTNYTEFSYAPNRARYKKTLNSDTSYYIGKHYEQENIGFKKLEKNYIYVGDELVAIHIEEDDGVMTLPQNRYMHKDALGSIDTITNESGVVIQRLAYDVFGKKIVIDEDKDKSLVKRGYTGHEHIEEFELIHMNGRVYDPSVGRFLSADPNVFYPYNPLDFNRYSYVWNNPLRYVDPSGFRVDNDMGGWDGNHDPGEGTDGGDGNDNSDMEGDSPSKIKKIRYLKIMKKIEDRKKKLEYESKKNKEISVLNNKKHLERIERLGFSIKKEWGELMKSIENLYGELRTKVINNNNQMSSAYNNSIKMTSGVYNGTINSYNNSHPAMKSIVTFSVSFTVGVLSPLAFDATVSYAVRNPETVIGGIELLEASYLGGMAPNANLSGGLGTINSLDNNDFTAP